MRRKIPAFVQDYLDQMDYECYPDFVKLSREYYQEQEIIRANMQRNPPTSRILIAPRPKPPAEL